MTSQPPQKNKRPTARGESSIGAAAGACAAAVVADKAIVIVNKKSI